MIIQLGSEYNLDFSFNQEDVITYSAITGDANPLHLDEEYATTTIFKKPIIHGILGASVFSKVLGTLFPGDGTIYISQSLRFIKPMYVNVSYKASFVVVDLIKDSGKALIITSILNEEGELVTTGEAWIKNKKYIN